MEKMKDFIIKHFEKILVLIILSGVIIINYFSDYKLAYLNFFYLPILIAGFFLGKRLAVITALLCILTIILLKMHFPGEFLAPKFDRYYVIISLVSWSSFLILTSAIVGYLYEEKEKRIWELKKAYIGVLEILSKYLESTDRYTQGHSVRVAHLSENIAKIMNLTKPEIENIKVAALLHDIGKTEISMDIVNKAAALSTEEKEIISSHSEKGAQILSMVGGILKEAVPLVLAHHKYYFELKTSSERNKKIPMGVSIIAVADAYDAIISDRPYRKGKQSWEAFEEIEKESGKQFHPDAVNALKKVLSINNEYMEENNENLKSFV